MTYDEAKATRDQIEAEVVRLARVLGAFPRTALGLTPDHIKASVEYRTAKAAFDAAFHRQRVFNFAFVKTFKREIAAERRARRFA